MCFCARDKSVYTTPTPFDINGALVPSVVHSEKHWKSKNLAIVKISKYIQLKVID